MQIETTCPGCGRALRVGAEHAGKTARCPVCNTIYNVPCANASNALGAAAAAGDRWYLKAPEGQTYGPVTRATLDNWVGEGRVSDDCQLLCEANGIWQPAVTVFPVLRPRLIPSAPKPVFDNPVAGGPCLPSPLTGTTPSVRVVNPHRGGLVLTLGILSWALGCPIFGIMAWVMGSNDLRDIQRGAMDPRGMALTQAGQIIGMIHAILTLIALVVGVFAMLALGVWR